MSSVEVVAITLRAGGETVPDMRFYYNSMDIRPERRDVDGWGTSVELAGVVQLLDAVAAGDLEIADMRRALVRVADELERQSLAETPDGSPSRRTPETLRCFGDCPRCEANAAEVRALYDQAAARRARLQHPDRYAVAVSGRSVHRLDCRVVRDGARTLRFAGENDDDSEAGFRSELRRFTHDGFRHDLPHLALTLDEYDRWRAERTGPAGGLYYRLCKVCDPDVPLA
jgi:hypothetical protein